MEVGPAVVVQYVCHQKLDDAYHRYWSHHELKLVCPNIKKWIRSTQLKSSFIRKGIDSGCGPASPLGALQPDLYQRTEGPIYLTAPDANVALGKLHLRINYDSHVFDLAVHLIEGSS